MDLPILKSEVEHINRALSSRVAFLEEELRRCRRQSKKPTWLAEAIADMSAERDSVLAVLLRLGARSGR